MESETSLIIGKLILYCLPLVLLLFFSKITQRHFKRQHSAIKLPDLLVPFLIFIFSLGIVVLLVIAAKKGEILYKSFFKTYWRFVFISSILAYYSLVTANVIMT